VRVSHSRMPYGHGTSLLAPPQLPLPMPLDGPPQDYFGLKSCSDEKCRILVVSGRVAKLDCSEYMEVLRAEDEEVRRDRKAAFKQELWGAGEREVRRKRRATIKQIKRLVEIARKRERREDCDVVEEITRDTPHQDIRRNVAYTSLSNSEVQQEYGASESSGLDRQYEEQCAADAGKLLTYVSEGLGEGIPILLVPDREYQAGSYWVPHLYSKSSSWALWTRCEQVWFEFMKRLSIACPVMSTVQGSPKETLEAAVKHIEMQKIAQTMYERARESWYKHMLDYIEENETKFVSSPRRTDKSVSNEPL